MKKSIITLLAVGGVVAAANPESLSTDNATGWMYAMGDSYTEWALGDLSVSANDEGDVTFSGDIAKRIIPYYGANPRNVTVIAFTLDLSKLEIPQGNTEGSYAESRMLTLNGEEHITGLGVNASGNLTGTWTDDTDYYSSGASIVGTTERSFVYVLGTGDGSHYTGGTQIYADNTESVWGNGDLKGDLGSNISTMTLESWAVGALKSMVIWSGVEAYDNKTLASDAFSVNQSIPEPTTATLSLLALAGLAARRRRK